MARDATTSACHCLLSHRRPRHGGTDNTHIEGIGSSGTGEAKREKGSGRVRTHGKLPSKVGRQGGEICTEGDGTLFKR